MKLDKLMALANGGKKRAPKSNVNGHPVKISKIKQKNGRIRLAMDVYKEPMNCHFAQTAYWQPVLAKEESRIYLIYSNAVDGYKVDKTVDNKVGRISFTNDEMLEQLNEYSNDKYVLFNWQWDQECSRPYIELK